MAEKRRARRRAHYPPNPYMRRVICALIDDTKEADESWTAFGERLGMRGYAIKMIYDGVRKNFIQITSINKMVSFFGVPEELFAAAAQGKRALEKYLSESQYLLEFYPRLRPLVPASAIEDDEATEQPEQAQQLEIPEPEPTQPAPQRSGNAGRRGRSVGPALAHLRQLTGVRNDLTDEEFADQVHESEEDNTAESKAVYQTMLAWPSDVQEAFVAMSEFATITQIGPDGCTLEFPGDMDPFELGEVVQTLRNELAVSLGSPVKIERPVLVDRA